MEETAFKDWNDYEEWFNSYLEQKAKNYADKYEYVSFDDVIEYFGTNKGWPKKLPRPSGMMESIFDDMDEPDLTKHTKEEAERILDTKFRKVFWDIDQIASNVDEKNNDWEEIADDLEVYDTKESEIFFRNEDEYYDVVDEVVGKYKKQFIESHSDLPEETLKTWIKDKLDALDYSKQDGEAGLSKVMAMPKEELEAQLEKEAQLIVDNSNEVIKYYNDHPYTTLEDAERILTERKSYDASSKFNSDLIFNSVDLFTFDGAGKIVTGIDSSTAFQNLYDSFVEGFDKDTIKNENWVEKGDKMLSDAQLILDNFEDFASQFDSFGGELGEALKENLELGVEDLRVLKDYVSGNIGRATEYLETLKEKIIEEEELQKVIDEKETAKEALMKNKPREYIPCTHTNATADGTPLHKNGDPNPEFKEWSKKVSDIDIELYKLKSDLVVIQKEQAYCLANIRVLNEVVIKFNSSPHWQKYKQINNL